MDVVKRIPWLINDKNPDVAYGLIPENLILQDESHHTYHDWMNEEDPWNDHSQTPTDEDLLPELHHHVYPEEHHFVSYPPHHYTPSC